LPSLSLPGGVELLIRPNLQIETGDANDKREDPNVSSSGFNALGIGSGGAFGV
jgi:hypothetical protein